MIEYFVLEPKFHYDLNPCSRSHCRDFASALVYVTFLCYELRSCFSCSVVKFSHAAATRKLQALSSCSQSLVDHPEPEIPAMKIVCVNSNKYLRVDSNGGRGIISCTPISSSSCISPDLHTFSSHFDAPHFIQAAQPFNIRNRCSSYSWRILRGIFFPPWPRYTTNLIKLPDCITAASFEITSTTQTSSKKANLHVRDRSGVKPSIRFLPAVWLQQFRSFHNSCTPAHGQHQLLTCSTHSEQELVNRPPIATC